MKNRLSLIFCIALLTGCTTTPITGPQTRDLTTEHTFTDGIEGPAVDKAGNLYAVNFGKQGTIGIIRPGQSPALFTTLPAGSVGNGIRFNRKGEMFVADYTGHAILKITTQSSTPLITVFAHDSRMHQPNDIAITHTGILFASDPEWRNNTGQLWRIDINGVVTLLEAGMSTTNGIEVSPDDRILYVNESVSRSVWAYDLDNEGNITRKRLLHQFSDAGLDGMRCDEAGNLYIARYDAGTIAVISPEGKLLREIRLKGKKPTNVTFGGADGKTLYVTLQDRGAIEYLYNETAGAR